MVRLFDTHAKRDILTLNGKWDFKTDPDNIGELNEWNRHFPSESDYMIIPSCWNTELGYYHYEGSAWYHKKFITKQSNLVLTFNAVAHKAKVFFDSILAGEHYGAFTPFEIQLQNVNAGEHEIVVLVDNVHNMTDTIPQAQTDWFHYGGIIRDVEIAHIDDAYIRNVKINYDLDLAQHGVTIKIDLSIYSFSSKCIKKTVTITFEDSTCLYKGEIDLNPGANKISLDAVTIDNVIAWDIDQPKLYYFSFDIGNDDYIDRVGFRTLKTQDGNIYLNNKSLVLKGINRHEDHPDWGFAFPVKLMKYDLSLIKNLGCNAIRGSHNPYHEAFLDLCDESGMLMWDEIPMAGHNVKQLINPLVIDRAITMMEEMIERDFNRPSVIIWSLFNECDTTSEAGYRMAELLINKVKSLDTSRLTTYATCEPLTDICYKLVDIVSVNQYFGWYGRPYSDWNDFMVNIKEKMLKDGVSDHPLMITEYGAAAIYGDKGFESRRWSEQYQAEVLEYATTIFLGGSQVAGMYIWQFCDVRSCKENDLTRARSFNNKGLLNEYRKPKLAYWAVQKLYKGNQ